MKKVLSVIIPTYNMEKYLSNCLNSFIDENIIQDIEVLIINDGSKDNSAAIAEEFVKMYPKTFILINKENGGHGSTINKGIEVATGKYFKVVDSDDWVDKKGFIALVSYLKSIDVDCVINPFYEFYQNSGQQKLINAVKGLPINEQFDYLAKFKKENFAMHAMTFKTEILKQNNITLFEHCFYVDTQYISFPLAYIKTAICFSEPIYMYRLDREGQSVGLDGYVKHLLEHRKVMYSLLDYLKNSKEKLGKNWKRVVRVVSARVTVHYSVLLNMDLNSEKTVFKKRIEELKAYDKDIKKNYPDIYKLIPFSLNMRVGIMLGFRGAKFLKKLSGK